MTSKLQRLFLSSKEIGRDSHLLLRALVNSIIVPRIKSLPSQLYEPKKRTQNQISYQDVLVEQSRSSNNRVAISLLSIQKEYGLLKYWGFRDYMKQKSSNYLSKWKSNSRNTISDSSTYSNAEAKISNDNNNSSQAKDMEKSATQKHAAQMDDENVAKVPFLITSSMKMELIQRLGYDLEIIKRLTPTDASLILHHNIMSEDMDEKLPNVLRKYHEKQKLTNQDQRQKMEKQQRATDDEKQHNDCLNQDENKVSKRKCDTLSERSLNTNTFAATSSTPTSSKVLPDSSKDLITIDEEQDTQFAAFLEFEAKNSSQGQKREALGLATSENASEEKKIEDLIFQTEQTEKEDSMQQNEDRKDCGKENNSISDLIWYQVIEIKTSDDGPPTVIGLYPTEEEAKFALGMKQEFQKSPDKDNDNKVGMIYKVIPKIIE